MKELFRKWSKIMNIKREIRFYEMMGARAIDEIHSLLILKTYRNKNEVDDFFKTMIEKQVEISLEAERTVKDLKKELEEVKRNKR